VVRRLEEPTVGTRHDIYTYLCIHNLCICICICIYMSCGDTKPAHRQGAGRILPLRNKD
jgi:hypothetical protein